LGRKTAYHNPVLLLHFYILAVTAAKLVLSPAGYEQVFARAAFLPVRGRAVMGLFPGRRQAPFFGMPHGRQFSTAHSGCKLIQRELTMHWNTIKFF
jgi:hypothetical protein